MQLSLVIPVKNESNSLAALIDSIEKQTFQPDEIILVDGGSTDETIELAEQFAVKNPGLKIIKVAEASPGKGRNLGIGAAENEWIALTDAGIKLDKEWLEKLSKATENSPAADIVYGNFAPVTDSFFEKCAAISFVPAANENSIRGRSVASMLLKKNVWKQVGGFPDLRAAEDLIFMEEADKQGFKSVFAPKAKIHWQICHNFPSTFKKFSLYSKHNALIGRHWDWHYGIVKHYLLVSLFVILAILHSWWWLFGIPAWLAARTAKRLLSHRYEYGVKILFNPFIFGGVALIILTIDAATFSGWGQSILNKSKN